MMRKQLAVAYASQSLNKGITSSPSFQELEKAIGAQLALGLNTDSSHSLENLSDHRGKKGSSIQRSKYSQNHLNHFQKPPTSPRRPNQAPMGISTITTLYNLSFCLIFLVLSHNSYFNLSKYSIDHTK